MGRIQDVKAFLFPVKALTLVAVVMVSSVSAILIEPYSANAVILYEEINSEVKIGYQQTIPATSTAVVVVRLIYSKVINFTFYSQKISCDGEGVAALVAKLKCKINIGVFIGPACSRALDALLPLARSWNIAIITPIGLGISDPDVSKLVTKLSPYSMRNYVLAVVAIMTSFNWFNLAIIYDKNYTESVTFKEELGSVIGTYPEFVVKFYPFNGSEYTAEKLGSFLIDASYFSRVFLMACQSNESRALMLQAYQLGYATSGEYVFFIVDELSKVPSPQYWQMGEPDDQIVLKALGHAIWPTIVVNREVIPSFKELVDTIALYEYGYDYNGTEHSPYLAGYFDSVLLYAQALYEVTYTLGKTITGTSLTERMWDRTFYGAYGLVRINSQGYRENNVSFNFFDIETGEVKQGAFYDYEVGMLNNTSDFLFDWPYSRGVTPLNEPQCGFKNTLCVEKVLPDNIIGTIAGLLCLVGVAGFLGAVFIYRSWKNRHVADLWWWKIQSCDLMMTARNEFSSMFMTQSRHNLPHVNTLVEQNSKTDRVMEGNVAVWKSQTVCLRRLSLKQLTITGEVLNEFMQVVVIDLYDQDVKDINHPNLVRIYGACFDGNLKALITEICIKGSLQDLLGKMNITLDTQFKCSICRDIINGLCYIHQSPIHKHGRLNSNVCLIDNRFSVKLTDFGLPTLYSNIPMNVTSEKYKNDCKWKAPEILRSGATATGTVEGDIYSYGMILLEIITQVPPFAAESDYMTTDEVIQKVIDGMEPSFRPDIELFASSSNLKELIQSCWAENPKDRPSSHNVKSCIKQITTSLGDSGNLMENLMRRMELYANNLEKMVEEKTGELREEKKKSEELLYQILPRSVAERLKLGLRVDPEAYCGVSIYFSDIVGFTEISAVSSPMEVVDLLNDIYSCFDAIIEEFDVYKVETIGDAYMVVSGLPQRNGNLHALNIAQMSIQVLETIRDFKIRHLPIETVKIRIGLHSGPVCAGVVGSKMPRYCLFGDTVNTASRMESSGEAMRIHISSSTKELLDQFGTFHVIPRGSIAVKGKGQMFTYWLQTSQNELTDLKVSYKR